MTEIEGELIRYRKLKDTNRVSSVFYSACIPERGCDPGVQLKLEEVYGYYGKYRQFRRQSRRRC